MIRITIHYAYSYMSTYIYICQNSNFIKMKRLKLVFHNVTTELPKMLTDNMTDGMDNEAAQFSKQQPT